jgi:hypothetical protein
MQDNLRPIQLFADDFDLAFHNDEKSFAPLALRDDFIAWLIRALDEAFA